jgi:hydroxyacylglutathione hydrolase
MPIAVEQLPLGSIGTNCYLVRADRTAAGAVVVDPGADAAEIRLALARSGAACTAILLTHSHYDHLGALADLAEGTGAPVWLPEAEREVFERPNDFYGSIGVSLRGFEGDATLLSGGETVEAAGLSFQVVSVPGHSPGHLAYYADGCLFSGDVLFAGSVGRTDLPFGDWDTLLDSIRRLAETYPPETRVFPGHGPTTTLGAELERNPFLAELRAT